MFKGFSKLFILCLIMSFLPSSYVLGQVSSNFEKRLKTFDREFGRVTELVRSLGKSDRAIQLLTEARNFRIDAENSFRNGRPREADAKLNAAFSKLTMAAKVTLEGPAKRWRNRVEELLRRAEHDVLGCNHKEAQRLLRDAKNSQQKADAAASKMNLAKAIEHLRIAEILAKRALKMIQALQERIQEERVRFEALRERAQNLVEHSSNRRAKRVYDKAMGLAVSAEEALHGCKVELAKRLYNQSIMLLLRAMDLARGDSREAIKQADVALFRLRELIEESRDCVQNSVRPRAKQLFERARRLASEAELAVKNHQNYSALWKIELAKNMLQRVCRISQGDDRGKISGRITREIENAKLDISEARSKLSNDGSEDAVVLLRMAEFTLRKAEHASAAGFERFALEAVLATQRFLSKAQRITRGQAPNALSKERVLFKLAKLDESISDSEARIVDSGKEWNLRFLNGAKDIRGLVDESIRKGNYRAADVTMDVAFELVRKSFKNLPKN